MLASPEVVGDAIMILGICCLGADCDLGRQAELRFEYAARRLGDVAALLVASPVLLGVHNSPAPIARGEKEQALTKCSIRAQAMSSRAKWPFCRPTRRIVRDRLVTSRAKRAQSSVSMRDLKEGSESGHIGGADRYAVYAHHLAWLP